jgi:hypothetical protein
LEPKRSSPCPQDPSTGLSPGPVKLILPFFPRSFFCCSIIYAQVPEVSRLTFCMHFLYPCTILIPSSWIVSSVSIVTRSPTGRPGSIPVMAKMLCLRYRIQTGSGGHPASCPMGTGDSFLGIKRPGREADHSLSLVPRLRMGRAIPPLPQYVFMAWFLVKHRDNFAYGLDDGGSSPGRGWEFFSSPPRPDRLWDPPSLLSNGYRRLFPCR